MLSFVEKLSLLLIYLLFSPNLSATAKCPSTELQVAGDGQCIMVKTFKSSALTNNPSLSIVVHGDSPFSNPDYQYAFAERLAKASKNNISIGILRPGYRDPDNRMSDGIRGETVGDNYDDERVAIIASAIQSLKNYHKAKEVILIGHSGGAAIVGKILALRPQLAQKAVLVSCPCDINAWRSDMFKETKNLAFKKNLVVSSPVDLVAKVSKRAEIKIIVGEKDTITRPYLSKNYYDALKASGVKKVAFIKIVGEHDILGTERVFDIVVNW